MHVLEIDVVGELDRTARYALLDRMRTLAERRGIRVMGFAVVHHLRFLLDGERAAIGCLARSLKSAASQGSGTRGIHLGDSAVYVVVDPVEALIDLHRRAIWSGDPLATPWSSHRDVMGYRVAPFFDASVWDGRLDRDALHAACGGRPVSPSVPATAGIRLDDAFRLAAAVLGVLPSDPRAFRLFSQIARWSGRRQEEIAAALLVTPRRVRQLLSVPEPQLAMAKVCASDPRLLQVP